MKRKNLKKNKGFTITELIVVMAIVAILTLIAVPMYYKYIKNAEEVDRNALIRATYIASVAYYVDNEMTEYLNPSYEDLKPYLKTDVEIVSGLGKENCNEHGHFKWGEYQGNEADKENFMCVHIVLKGGTYRAAGITNEAEDNYIVIETYDPSIDRQFNNESEPNVRYFIQDF